MNNRTAVIVAVICTLLLAGMAGAQGKGAAADLRPYWVALSVPNAEATANWYSENLAFTVTRRMSLPEHGLRIVFLEANGFHLELIESQDIVSFAAIRERLPQAKSRDRVQGYVKLGFMLEDVDALAAALKKKGIALRMEPTDDPAFGVRFFLVEDNAGNLLQFFQPLKH